MVNVFPHICRAGVLFVPLIWFVVLAAPFFQAEVIPAKSISSRRHYIPMEKAEFEYEWENFELQIVEDSFGMSSAQNFVPGILKRETSDFDFQRSPESTSYVFENSFLSFQFDFFLHRIFDTSAFLQDFLKPSTCSYFHFFAVPDNEGLWRILFSSLVSLPQSRKVKTLSPYISSVIDSSSFPFSRSFASFPVNGSRAPRALIPGKLSRYFALLFHFPPHFNLGPV